MMVERKNSTSPNGTNLRELQHQQQQQINSRFKIILSLNFNKH